MKVVHKDSDRGLFCRRLRAICAENRVTFNEIAERLEINRTTLYKWRSPKFATPGPIVTLIAIADMFDVSVDWLLGRTDERCPRGLRIPARAAKSRCSARATGGHAS